MSLAKKNDIDFEINLPNHSSLNNDTTLAKEKFKNEITCKEEKLLLDYRKFIYKYQQCIDTIIFSKPDEKNNVTVLIKNR